MKIESVFLFALAIGACPLVAQYSLSPSSLGSSGIACMEGKNTPCPVPPAVSRCPVSMRAQHLSDGNLLQAGRTQHPKGIGQRLHLTLGNPHGHTIVGARVSVHGYTPNGRLLQASPIDGGNADATRSLNISFSAAEANTVSADLWAPGMTAVQSIEVNSITYADGSTWKLTGNLACHVTPDGSMLISAR